MDTPLWPLAWDWPWLVSLTLALCALTALPQQISERWDPGWVIFSIAFATSLVAPLSLPLMALWGQDFWLPLLSFCAGFWLYIHLTTRHGNEANSVLIWHLLAILLMVPLAVVIRGVAWLFSV